jgi:hypothetical protein
MHPVGGRINRGLTFGKDEIKMGGITFKLDKIGSGGNFLEYSDEPFSGGKN